MYFTGSAGGDYDLAPYDAIPIEFSSLETILTFAQAQTLRPEVADVLDLGCGFGRQLAQVAPFVAGRLVGVDASHTTCEGARAIVAPWSARAEIIQADFADLNADQLGSFDLIYCVGTLYTLPDPLRNQLLDTIRKCLRPGGMVLLSYYAGTFGLIKAAVAQYLRSLQQPGVSLADAVAAARDHLSTAAQLQTPSPISAVKDKIAEAARYDNVVMAHEVLGHGMKVQNTALLAAALAPADITFIGYLGYDPSNFASEPSARLYLTETLDLLEGGYRYALFARAAS